MKSLARYFEVTQNLKPARFLIAKAVPVDFDESNSLRDLWRKHSDANRYFSSLREEIEKDRKVIRQVTVPHRSFLDLKIELVKRILTSCHLCSRKCGVNRLKGKTGFCGCGTQMAVASVFTHMGEEPELVPSGTIFTSGCTIKCKICQNWTISQWIDETQSYDALKMSREIERLRSKGCRNINLVGGEPTPWLKQWLEAFRLVNINVPVVWNSNSYYSHKTARLLEGFVDLYLLDFKYGPKTCAEKISEAPRYWQICTQNHLRARRGGDLLIRLLVLPGHLQCCVKPILGWIAKKLGTDTRVNLMFQYHPEWRAHEMPALRRRLKDDEILEALRLARENGLENLVK